MIPRTWGALLGDVNDYLKSDRTAIPTGLPTIDALTRGGFRAGHVALLVGRTGVGKSFLAGQIAVNVAKQGKLVGFSSLEMSKEEVAIRCASALFKDSIEDAEQRFIGSDLGLMGLKHLSIDDTPKPDFLEMAKWVNEVQELYGQKMDLVVIDHLKLLRRYSKSFSEAERVARLSEDAKSFAKQAGVAVLCVHQVGRNEGDKKNHGDIPLSLESMMYGGEQDADYALGVYRPALNPSLSATDRQLVDREVCLQLLKNRHGPQRLDPIPLVWQKPSAYMYEAEFSEPEEEVDYL